MEIFEGMPPRVTSAFEAYLALGERPSLRSLSANLQRPSIATLKRWSTRYQWQMRFAAYNRQKCEQRHEAFMKSLVDQRQEDLKVIDRAKERFFKRIEIDPNDPNLTLAQRRRALKPITISQFIKLIKLEQLLLGSERSPTMRESTSRERHTHEELVAMQRALAEVRYGLPHRPTR